MSNHETISSQLQAYADQAMIKHKPIPDSNLRPGGILRLKAYTEEYSKRLLEFDQDVTNHANSLLKANTDETINRAKLKDALSAIIASSVKKFMVTYKPGK